MTGGSEMATPYKPSWVDRYIDWIDALPIPAWLFYLLLYGVAVLFLHLSVWLDGVAPFGELGAVWFANAVWAVISVIFVHDMRRAARRAIDRFAPLLANDPEVIGAFRYQLTVMPARPVLVLSTITALLMVVAIIVDPEFIYTGLSDPLAYALAGSVLVYSYALALVVFYNTIRQLRLVARIYELVQVVNPFHQEPLYAFSGLSMRAGLVWILLVNLTLLSTVLFEISESELVINYLFAISALTVAFLAFLLPLWGIHQRIAAAKSDAMEENSLKITRVQRQLYETVDADVHTKASALNDKISSLYLVRQQIRSLPTWPWTVGTLRAFLSAVFAPMLLWGLQLVIARMIG